MPAAIIIIFFSSTLCGRRSAGIANADTGSFTENAEHLHHEGNDVVLEFGDLGVEANRRARAFSAHAQTTVISPIIVHIS
jgi:hypothetical protein